MKCRTVRIEYRQGSTTGAGSLKALTLCYSAHAALQQDTG
jgi:hypothetical protein